MGTTGSGKTTLFNYLFTKEYRNTVSSFEENLTSGKQEVKVGKQETRSLECIDLPGHFNFRNRMLEVLD